MSSERLGRLAPPKVLRHKYEVSMLLDRPLWVARRPTAKSGPSWPNCSTGLARNSEHRRAAAIGSLFRSFQIRCRRRQVQSPIPAIDARFREMMATVQLAGHSSIGPACLLQGRLGY